MADTFYGVAIGAGLDDNGVTVDTSTTSKGIELRTADGAGLTKVALLNGLEAIRAKIEQGNAPA
jgi:hypothetical protein